MHVRTLVSILFLFSGLGACRSTRSAPAEHAYTLVLIQTGPYVLDEWFASAQLARLVEVR
jgi:hypothetical protein